MDGMTFAGEAFSGQLAGEPGSYSMNAYTGLLTLSIVYACSPVQPRFAPGEQRQVRAETGAAETGAAETGAAEQTMNPVGAGFRTNAPLAMQQSHSDIRSQDARKPNAAEASALASNKPSGSEADLQRTRNIRHAVMSDGSLSFTAMNVKIQTVDGNITLRGQVKDARERNTIEALARRLASGAPVTNHITVRN